MMGYFRNQMHIKTQDSFNTYPYTQNHDLQ